MNKLRKIRKIVAVFFLVNLTLLFLDFTGTMHDWFGWMAKIQFFPAILALNIVVFALVLLTLLLGRVYCSTICPLGVLQDLISKVATKIKKNRFTYSPAMNKLRYVVLGLFIVAFILLGAHNVVALLEPYSAFGRIVSTLLSPIYLYGNNILAGIAERADSYAFYRVDIFLKSMTLFAVAIVTLVAVGVLAWRNGRTYCNTICPVGTLLGFLSRFSFYKHRIDASKCNNCGLCAMNCKASCINPEALTVDYSRCVSCFNCSNQCSKNAMLYSRSKQQETSTNNNNNSKNNDNKNSTEKNVNENNDKNNEQVNTSLRTSLAMAGTLLATSVVKTHAKTVDGGFVFLEDKKSSERQTPLIPPGSQSIRNFKRQCTSCQLCITVCSNNVLRSLDGIVPDMTFDRGYCRPECVKCSEVCPTGAIKKITVEEKSSTQIGHAVWLPENCVVLVDGVKCDNCARSCPAGAIDMVAFHSGNNDSKDVDTQKIPAINTERCIGCGACEHLCPSRPYSAIYVEGHIVHRII